MRREREGEGENPHTIQPTPLFSAGLEKRKKKQSEELNLAPHRGVWGLPAWWERVRLFTPSSWWALCSIG